MTIHRLKILPVYFKAIESGIKYFEIRNNLDRGFQKGDTAILQEYNPESDYNKEHEKEPYLYTGREIMVNITYVTNYEQKENYVVFGFGIMQISDNPIK